MTDAPVTDYNKGLEPREWDEHILMSFDSASQTWKRRGLGSASTPEQLAREQARLQVLYPEDQFQIFAKTTTVTFTPHHLDALPCTFCAGTGWGRVRVLGHSEQCAPCGGSGLAPS